MNGPLPEWIAWIIIPLSLGALVGIFIFTRRLDRRLKHEEIVPTNPTSDCFNEYLQRDYKKCSAYGQRALEIQFSTTLALITILALRRLELAKDAEDLSRKLLAEHFGPRGIFLNLMRVLDGHLDPERFLQEVNRSDDPSSYRDELECQIHYYWGAKLFTEHRFVEAVIPLTKCLTKGSTMIEHLFAKADLATAEQNKQ